jgi:hypothetical protein
MHRWTIIIGLALLVGGLGQSLRWPESLFANASVSDLALLLLGAL